MGEKKIAIIGAGISGLSAGCYLQMNGYETEIFELHTIPGGLCTAWERKGYTFDFCIHWLLGSAPGDAFYGMWNELIDMPSLEFVYDDVFFQVEDEDGRALRIFTDIDRLEKEMKDVAPEDGELIEEFTAAIRTVMKIKFSLNKAPEVMSPLDGLKMMVKIFPHFKTLKKWDAISADQFAARCRSPLLRKAFLSMFLPDTSVFFLLMTLAGMHNKTAGYPIGGSLNFAKLIEKKYTDLGGKVHYNSKVSRISVEDNRACGLVLQDGRECAADIVISAADGYSTIFKMLGGKYVDEDIQDFYSGSSRKLKVFPSLVFVALGIARSFTDDPPLLVFPLEEEIVIDDSTRYKELSVRIFNFDPTLAPAGKTCLTVGIGTYNYQYWANLRKDDLERYRREKERIASEVIEALEKRLGDIKANIEVINVSTPASLMRYTDNWKGSFEGWQPDPGTMMMRMKKNLPGLKDFYLIGQWVHPGGGLPPAIMSGRHIAQIICKADGRNFSVD